MEGPKFAILMCAEDSNYLKQTYGGFYGVYVRMLKEEGEIWDLYNVARGDFSADDVIRDYYGFVITGSCNEADADDIWISKLIALLKKLIAMEKKVLGICFGHQVFFMNFCFRFIFNVIFQHTNYCQVYIYIYIYIYIYMCVCVCVCVCMYIYTFFFNIVHVILVQYCHLYLLVGFVEFSTSFF
ncbi:hypothetical protein PHJA_002830500 [Phtheirospermum japonicum]|uniref:Glutamine amidotransferase domain-containing protein n=1 Tax=Phtheirospermum japonicum TaxID=374723 RepID=A0A830DEF7_9LAMI|nr:hypothetical protein PHJA_002830500 [Phtheirospermum japonicum]